MAEHSDWRGSEDNVAEYYNRHAEREHGRLVKDAYHALEFDVTLHYLRKHLPPRGHLLDVGGGSGRYCIELARWGYRMTLADVSPRLLSIAERESSREAVTSSIASIDRADCRDLSIYRDGQFDGVLALGPIYHLIDSPDRDRAVSEIARVSKSGAPVFLSGISRYGLYRTLLTHPEFEYEFTDRRYVEEMIRGGVHRASWHDEDDVFPDAWFCTPLELARLAEDHGYETLEIAACEGLSSHHREATERLRRNERAWQVWWDILLETSNEPSLVGASEHMLYIGRKA